MQGIQIFTHAVGMVTRNFNAVLRIAGILLLVQLVLVFSLGEAYFARGMASGEVVGEMMGTAQSSGLLLIASLVQFVFALWIAVAWHRYILLQQEPAGYIPAWNGAEIIGYFKAGLILVLILIAVMIPVMMIGGMLLLPLATNGQASLLAGLLGALLLYVPAAYIAYRLSPILPAAAIGKAMTLKDAWYQTSPSGAAFVVLTVVSVLAGWLVNMPASLIAPVALPIALVWVAVAQWLAIVVGASILTTIYGHYVQKRDLNA
ncbi:hypothetical protein [Pararhodobacter oceanensis]|uniref:hypothetical protein n=1 Tax=Pararhodobacter oceanensis TaxID=2172121 RepID=UPI003A949277